MQLCFFQQYLFVKNILVCNLDTEKGDNTPDNCVYSPRRCRLGQELPPCFTVGLGVVKGISCRFNVDSFFPYLGDTESPTCNELEESERLQLFILAEHPLCSSPVMIIIRQHIFEKDCFYLLPPSTQTQLIHTIVQGLYSCSECVEFGSSKAELDSALKNLVLMISIQCAMRHAFRD